jgi:large subunit ribosomal protein L25
MTISAQVRRDQNNKKLRKIGRVPAVLYGKGISSLPIDLDVGELKKEMDRSSGLLDVNVDGKPYRVVVRQVQKDPIKNEWLHVDLLAVSKDEEVEVEVPVTFVGEAIGAKQGGVLQHIVTRLFVRCKPDQLPAEIPIDVTHLEIGDSISVADIASRFSFKITSDPETVIASVSAPAKEAEEKEVTEEESETTITD